MVPHNKGKIINRSGHIFGRLKVRKSTQVADRDGFGVTYALCDCRCGLKNIRVLMRNLTTGNTKSCGCLRAEMLSERGSKRRQNVKDEGRRTQDTANTTTNL